MVTMLLAHDGWHALGEDVGYLTYLRCGASVFKANMRLMLAPPSSTMVCGPCGESVVEEFEQEKADLALR